MANPYIGEVRLFAGNFPPQGWALCDGALMAISEYDTLFNLIGTTYGGDGQTTFALPDLRGRVPVHYGNTYVIGETGGRETVTLTSQQIPAHNHAALASAGSGTLNAPNNALPAAAGAHSGYSSGVPDVVLASTSMQSTGGSQPHENLQPYLAMNYIISLFGIWPSPT